MELHEKIIHGWDISAEGYSRRIVASDFVSPGADIWKNLILSKAPAEGKMRILDAGTGPGVFAALLAQEGHEVTGIDISEKMLDEARQNAAAHGVSPDFRIMDAQAPDFPDNTFDMIVSRNVFWIMEHPEDTYRNWRGILKPGGRIVEFDGGHGENDFLTQFDYNNETYFDDYRKKFGKEPPVSFERGRYEEARGFKRDLKLTYVRRPEWDVEVLTKLGFRNISWENVADQAYYTEEEKYENRGRIFFRLCADKPE